MPADRSGAAIDLAGFADEASNLARRPVWERAGLPSLEVAEAEARHWIRGQPAGACVEVMETEGDVSRVVLFVTLHETQEIG